MYVILVRPATLTVRIHGNAFNQFERFHEIARRNGILLQVSARGTELQLEFSGPVTALRSLSSQLGFTDPEIAFTDSDHLARR